MAQKQKFNLSADIIKLGPDPEEMAAEGRAENAQKPQSVEPAEKKTSVHFWIPDAVRKEFTVWCAERSLKHNEAFLLIFNKIKETDISKK